MGNLVSSRSAQQPCKEEYTGQLYKKFCTEKHVEAVKHFLEVISTVGANPNENTLLEPVLLKEGWANKSIFYTIYIFYCYKHWRKLGELSAVVKRCITVSKLLLFYWPAPMMKLKDDFSSKSFP